LFGPPDPSQLIIYNWHVDDNGDIVGDYNGEQLCNSDGYGCQGAYWDSTLGQWDNPCDGPCISKFAHQALGQAGTLADRGFKSALANMAIGDTIAAGGVIAADAAAGPWESSLFGRNGGLLNSNGLLRIGYGWNGNIGQNVFRIGGTLIGLVKNNPHIDLWPPSSW
jgi:hypothetical protein